MQISVAGDTIQTIDIMEEALIAAPIQVVFDSVLEQLGPSCRPEPDHPLPLKIEAWPGGRWFRDLGDSAGHLWGHVQAIKPPTLLEFYGPMYMSYPAMNNLQIRLSAEGESTRLKFHHQVLGLLKPEDRELEQGWANILSRIREMAEAREK